MSLALRVIAVRLFSSAAVQQVVANKFYNPDHLVKQSLVAAQAFSDVVSELDLDSETHTVALCAFSNKASVGIAGGDRGYFLGLAQEACDLALMFDTEFKKVFAPGDLPAKAEAPPVSDPNVVTREYVPTVDKPKVEVKVVDVPTEKLKLPKNVEEMLLAAGMTTALGIKEADGSGKVLAIDGVGPQLRTKILAACDAKLAEAAEEAKAAAAAGAGDPPAATGTEETK